MRIFIPFIVLFFSYKLSAAETIVFLGPSINSQYIFKSLDVSYNLTGFNLGLDVLYPPEMSSESFFPTFWGWGLNLISAQAEIKNSSLATSITPIESNLSLLDLKFIGGLNYGDFKISVPFTPFVYLLETSGLNKGDEKYGYGAGLEMSYKIFSFIGLKIFYQVFNFYSGKNKSTNKSGSLANKSNLNYISASLIFPLNWGETGVK